MPSRFNKDTIREFFEHCQRTGLKRVNSITGLTEHAYKTGNNDEEIKAWLFPGSVAALVPCPKCSGSGRVPEPAPTREPSCPLCSDRKEITRYNFTTERDEIVPCPCVARALPAEEVQDARREAARREGVRMLSRMLGVSEIAIPFPRPTSEETQRVSRAVARASTSRA